MASFSPNSHPFLAITHLTSSALSSSCTFRQQKKTNSYRYIQIKYNKETWIISSCFNFDWIVYFVFRVWDWKFSHSFSLIKFGKRWSLNNSNHEPKIWQASHNLSGTEVMTFKSVFHLPLVTCFVGLILKMILFSKLFFFFFFFVCKSVSSPFENSYRLLI